MSNESVPDCLNHKDSRNIQVRLDYMLLYRNEAKAKVIRTMETWTDQKRGEWYKLQSESKEQGSELPKEPPEEALWVTMSYEEFSIFAYGTIKRDDIKAKVDDLVRCKHLKRRPHPTMPGVAPQYLLNTKLLQKALDEQDLPSLFEDIGKIAPPRKKHTPREKYPQGEGINTPRVGGKIPPGTGDFSYPSKNTTKNYEESTENESTYDADASPAHMPINFEEKKQRKTNPEMQAVKGQNDDLASDTRGSGGGDTDVIREDVRGVRRGDTPLITSSSHSHVDIGNDEEEEDVSLAETQKHKAVKVKGQADDHHRDTDHGDTSSDADHSDHPQSLHDLSRSPGHQNGTEGNQLRSRSITHGSLSGIQGQINEQQKPGAGGAHFSPADTPPGVGTGDATSVQAPIPGESGTQPAQHSGAVLDTSVKAGAAQVIPKRPPYRRPPTMIEKAQLTLEGGNVKQWYEEIRDVKVRMIDKNIKDCNALAECDGVTFDSLKATIEYLDKLKWVIEHDYSIDLHVLAGDKQLNFENNWPQVKRKQNGKAKSHADTYGNDYSLTALADRQQKAM